MTDRTHRELTKDNGARTADAYHACRDSCDEYQHVPCYCKSTSLEEVAKHDCFRASGRSVGAEPQPKDRESLEQKTTRLIAQ